MPVTESQMAAMRAYLEDDFERHKEIFNDLALILRQNEFPVLVSAAFNTALEKALSPSITEAQISTLVAQIREGYFKDPEALNPAIAEKLIRFWAGDDEALDGIDPVESVKTQYLLIRPLVHEAGIPDSGLDTYLNEVEALANDWLQR